MQEINLQDRLDRERIEIYCQDRLQEINGGEINSVDFSKYWSGY